MVHLKKAKRSAQQLVLYLGTHSDTVILQQDSAAYCSLTSWSVSLYRLNIFHRRGSASPALWKHTSSVRYSTVLYFYLTSWNVSLYTLNIFTLRGRPAQSHHSAPCCHSLATPAPWPKASASVPGTRSMEEAVSSEDITVQYSTVQYSLESGTSRSLLSLSSTPSRLGTRILRVDCVARGEMPGGDSLEISIAWHLTSGSVMCSSSIAKKASMAWCWHTSLPRFLPLPLPLSPSCSLSLSLLLLPLCLPSCKRKR